MNLKHLQLLALYSLTSYSMENHLQPPRKMLQCSALQIIITKSPELKSQHMLLQPAESPSEFSLDGQCSMRVEKNPSSDENVLDIKIYDTHTHRVFSPPLQCPCVPHSATVTSFFINGIHYTTSIIPQVGDSDN